MKKLPPQTPERIRAMRLKHNLTQTEAAALVYASLRTWQQWEADDRVMATASWELFLLKLGEWQL